MATHVCFRVRWCCRSDALQVACHRGSRQRRLCFSLCIGIPSSASGARTLPCHKLHTHNHQRPARKEDSPKHQAPCSFESCTGILVREGAALTLRWIMSVVLRLIFACSTQLPSWGSWVWSWNGPAVSSSKGSVGQAVKPRLVKDVTGLRCAARNELGPGASAAEGRAHLELHRKLSELSSSNPQHHCCVCVDICMLKAV